MRLRWPWQRRRRIDPPFQVGRPAWVTNDTLRALDKTGGFIDPAWFEVTRHD